MFLLSYAFCLFLCLFFFLVWVTWRVKNETRGSCIFPRAWKKKEKAKEKKELVGRVKWSIWSSVSMSCYPFFSVIILVHTIVYWWWFFYYLLVFLFYFTEQCISYMVFFLGDGFQGCLLVHTCMRPIWLKS